MKARLPQGYSNKGMGNMNNMVKQAQKMQEDIQAVQERLEQTDFTETAGGGMVELTMTGGRVLKEIKINPEIVDKDEIDELQDIIVAGVNAILTKIDDESAKEMEKVTGGVSFPGLF
ncbi:MAG: YbaB/EbfC family nucleoid-associated protein [Ruminiclostridium sp.]|nr:YbaB/EbfC family nucleoid-associated protein [Ruminiclostridium sp.]MBQ8842427.1 YbaB/EbfC family nucleoid-associated protein [Ruminiclostridium sp.]